jgi:hypothetical protein
VIVDPDFIDHWKTRMLVAALGDDELAPIYVLRLWAHCQNRRMWVFDLPCMALKGICRFQGDAQAFEDAMVSAGFISREGKAITVLGWEEYNASLIAAWNNGGKGGRPKKEPTENPRVNPQDNPQKTQGEPTGEPIGGDEIGVDEKREEQKAKASAAPKRSRASAKTPLPADFSISDRVKHWAAERGHSNLERHLETFISKCRAKGYTYADWDEGFMGAIREDWARLNTPQPRASPQPYKTAADRQREIADALTGRARDDQDEQRTIDI